MTNQKISKENVYPGLASILVPSVQLLAVLIVDFSKVLNINNVFIYPHLLNLTNLLSILITASVIGLIWHSTSTSPSIFILRDEEDFFNNFDNLALKYSFFALFIGFVVFVVATIAPYWDDNVKKSILGLLQILSYSGIIVSSGVIFFAWVTKYTNKKKEFQTEDFIQQFQRTLEEYGLIEPRQIKILKNEKKDYTGTRVVHIKISGTDYVVTVSADAKEITNVFTEEEYNETLKIEAT